MNAIIRLMAAVSRVSAANPAACGRAVEAMVSEIESCGADVVVFPSLALSSPSCGNLFGNSALLDSALEWLDHLRVATSHLPCYILVGLPVMDSSGPASVIAVLYRGERIGLLPTADCPPALLQGALSDSILPHDTVFACGDLRFVVLSCDPLALPVRIGSMMNTGFDLVVVPSYQPARAGYYKDVLETLVSTSRSFGCAIVAVNGGLGDTSAPFAYRGFAAVCECGEILKAEQVDNSELTLVCDLDRDIISARKAFNNYKAPHHSILPQTRKHGLLRPISCEPFLPEDKERREKYLQELFELQCLSLAARLENTGIKKMVLGVSGGLDSALALLVAAGAADRLSIGRESIIALTMPGLGTSDRTYQNAIALISALGCEGRDISIRRAVLGHFSDIGHNPDNRDTTYENAQARERTQVLLDIANMSGALMVGSGDLSEIALGWSTFGGDHLAGYNVNACLTKGMVRAMVRCLAATSTFESAMSVLLDILDTPISPELLPPGETGAVFQKTEDILGPYELHDFFLYNLLHNGFRPGKLYYYACIAFLGRYEPGYIKDKLVLFLKRFCAGQFKRSCAPDGAALTDVNLMSSGFYIPSDMSADVLLADIEGISF